MSDTSRRAFGATVWSALDVCLRQGVQFVGAVILARLVSPADFGLLSALSLFVGLASVLSDGGLAAAIIQRRDVEERHLSSAFWANAATGAGISAVLFLAAPAIANTVHLPESQRVAQWLSISVFLSALYTVPNAILQRQLLFKRMLVVNTASAALGVAAGIGCAVKGYGVWALVAQTLTSSAVAAMLGFLVSEWLPRALFERDALSSLWKFGAFLLLSNGLDVLFNRASGLIVARNYGPDSLGYYARADSTRQLPVGVLTAILGRVALRLFAEHQSDHEKLRRGAQGGLEAILLINTPMMVGVGLCSSDLLTTLYGPAWQPAAKMLSVLALAAIVWPYHVVNLSVLTACGKSSTFFRLELTKKIIGTVALVLGASFGIWALIWGQVVYSVMSMIINIRPVGTLIGYALRDQLEDGLPILVACCPMAFAVILVRQISNLDAPSKLLLEATIGCASFFITCYVFRIRAFFLLLRVVGRRHGTQGI